MRMLMNNLDEEVGERPRDLVVYGGTGRAARNWECYHAILASLKALANDETLLVQSGKPVGVFKTHEYAPRVLIANANLVGHWSNWEKFNELERAGLMMYGQMTAGSWIYIGSQGIVQGTFETFAAAGEKHFGGELSGKLIVSGGMGGMGGAQPLAATMTGAAFLGIDVDPERIKKFTEYADDVSRHDMDFDWADETRHAHYGNVWLEKLLQVRGADRDLLSLLFRSWVEHGQLPAQMSTLSDVANTLVSLVITAHANPSVVPEIVQLSPRIRPTARGRTS